MAYVDLEPLANTDNGHGDGPHDPDSISLSRCNSAAVHADELGSRHGVHFSQRRTRCFAFTVRGRGKDAEGDLAGYLILHTPRVPDNRWRASP